MKFTPLAASVIIAASVLLFVSIIAMPEPALYSIIVTPMVIPNGKEFLRRIMNVLTSQQMVVVAAEPEQATE